MKKALLLTFSFALFVAFGFSQTGKYWSPNSESRSNIVKYKAANTPAFPKEFKLFNLNVAPLRQQLMKVADNAVSHTTVISLPNADGQIEDFEVVEASNFEPALQAEYPMIRTFSGKGITDRTASLKISICPAGIQTMIFRADKPSEFIEKYSQDQTVYAVFKSQRLKGQLGWTCSTQEKETVASLNAKVNATSAPLSSTGELKTMRLAQSCNGEYADYFGASTAGTPTDFIAVYGGINATMARCNGVYEKDLGIHLNLIATNDNVIYFNAATDPYSNNLNNWNGELQNTLTSVIGEANYDIGHMFGESGGGGNAGCIGCVCVNGSKGSGITSPGLGGPEGDNFDIDYVVHEVGHQMGANHTFSMSNEGSGVNKEVGSGITIMGYAGITNQDVAPHSIDIFHEASIQQIQLNMGTKTCPVTTNISANNATPVVGALSPHTIPISTPFQLIGSATDANAGDVLTYCWEQNDNASGAQTNAQSVASATKASGPNWLSFSPTVGTTRYCPRLQTVLAGALFTGPLPGGDAGTNIEYLSSVNRTLNFRLTVRDNAPYSSTAPVSVGQTSFADMAITVTNTSGPFQVTQPNTALSWQAGTTHTITWAVANTTAPPVSCANVKISLSIDGGFTWPIVLVASTANDGTEDVVIPNNVTTTARVVIESVGNIFFDISNTNFTITAPATGFSFNSIAPTLVPCGGAATASATLGTTATGGFSDPITLSASGAPAGTNVTFGTSPLTPGNSSTVILNGVNTLTPGTYDITVTGTAGTVVQTSTVSFTVQPGTPPAITTQPTAAPSVCSGDVVSLTAASSASGVSYQWQVDDGSGGGFVNAPGTSNTATYTFTATQAMDGNQYNVIISTLCGSATSNTATLTVNTAANITTQPANQNKCEGDNATFTVVAGGTGVTYQWQVFNPATSAFVDITGATAASLTIPGVTAALDGTQYQVVISSTGSACPAPGVSNTVTLTVNPQPTVGATADVAAVCSGSAAVLTATGAATYTWQPGGASGASITVNPEVLPSDPSNPNTVTYTVTGTTSGCSATATVNVTANPLPAVSLVANPAISTITLPSQIVTLTADVSPAGSNYTYEWTQNGSPITNTGNSIQVDYNTVGEYAVTVSINGQCAKTSNKVNITDSIPEKFYIYPNPNEGQFVIQLKNPNLVGNVTVFDSKGSRVFTQVNSVTRLAYELISVDIRSLSSGIYVLAIYDKSGERLATERIVVRR